MFFFSFDALNSAQYRIFKKTICILYFTRVVYFHCTFFHFFTAIDFRMVYTTEIFVVNTSRNTSHEKWYNLKKNACVNMHAKNESFFMCGKEGCCFI